VVNRKFNGVDIGDSAVAFFEKLAKLESGGKYDLADQKYYIGKYQIGTDVLMDMGWLPKGSTWSNARFIGEAATKWKLTGKQSFLNTPAAQDEVIMRSVKMRWATLKKHKDKICKNIAVPIDENWLTIYSAGHIKVPANAKANLSNEDFVSNEMYYLSQNINGGFQKEYPTYSLC